jgi:hypothetical protein
MVLLGVTFKALKLEIDFESVQAADIAFSLFVFSNALTFLPDLRILVDYCASKYFEDYFLDENYIGQVDEKL